MSAIVAAMGARAWHVKMLRQAGRAIGGPTGAHMLASADYHERRMAAAGRAIVDASNAAGAGRVVAMRLAGCGCVEVTRGDGSTRIDPFMPWRCDPRPCAWPRPFARGADR